MNEKSKQEHAMTSRFRKLIPFDSNFTGHGLSPYEVNKLLAQRRPEFLRNTFDWEPMDSSMFAIDVRKLSNFKFDSKRSWNELFSADGRMSGNGNKYDHAELLDRCLVSVKLWEDNIIPVSDKHDILVRCRGDGNLSNNVVGKVILRNSTHAEAIKEIARLRRLEAIPFDADAKIVDSKDGKEECSNRRKLPNGKNLLSQIFSTDKEKPKKDPDSKEGLDSRFKEAQDMHGRFDGNIVDNNLDLLYTDDKTAKIGVGDSALYISDKEVVARTDVGEHGFRIGSSSSFKLGSSVVIDTPIENIEYGPQSLSFNPLLQYLPVGTIVHPYPALIPRIPTEILQTAQKLGEVVELLRGVL